MSRVKRFRKKPVVIDAMQWNGPDDDKELSEDYKRIARAAYYFKVNGPYLSSVYSACAAVLAKGLEDANKQQAPSPCKHEWVCGLDAQQCVEDCKHGEHSPNHLICRKCKAHKANQKQPVPQCPHCGPVCYGGAAHNAKMEDGVMYEKEVSSQNRAVMQNEELRDENAKLKEQVTSIEIQRDASNSELTIAEEQVTNLKDQMRGMYNKEQIDSAIHDNYLAHGMNENKQFREQILARLSSPAPKTSKQNADVIATLKLVIARLEAEK